MFGFQHLNLAPDNHNSQKNIKRRYAPCGVNRLHGAKFIRSSSASMDRLRVQSQPSAAIISRLACGTGVTAQCIDQEIWSSALKNRRVAHGKNRMGSRQNIPSLRQLRGKGSLSGSSFADCLGRFKLYSWLASLSSRNGPVRVRFSSLNVSKSADSHAE